MSSQFLYRLPVEQTQWKVEGQTTTAFTWECPNSPSSTMTAPMRP